LSKSLKHLTVEAVKAIQREVFAAHGGAAGIRDQALLESAVAAPQASIMGQTPHFRSARDRSGISILHLPQSSVPRWQQTHCARCVSCLLGGERSFTRQEIADQRLGTVRSRSGRQQDQS